MPFDVVDANNNAVATGFNTHDDAQAFIDGHASEAGLTVIEVAPVVELNEELNAVSAGIDGLLAHVSQLESELAQAQSTQQTTGDPVDLTPALTLVGQLKDKLAAAK